MKIKIVFFFIACSLGVCATLACGTSECGGGKTQCCKDVWGGMYYCPPPKPPKT